MKLGSQEKFNLRYRDRAIYTELKALPPLIVRADGRNFKRLIGDSFEKPYDERFAKGMAEAATIFFERSGFDPKLAYTFSDEINLFFTHVPFNGRIEKLDSVIAGFLASALAIALDFREAIAFDARVIPICSKEDVCEYLALRQAEAWRNCINAYGFYGLRAAGLSGEEAEQHLEGMKAMEVHDLLFQKGINLNEIPTWQKRGILIAREEYEKEGYDPRAGKNVTVTRYKVVQLWDLPLFSSEDGRNLLAQLIEGL